MRGLLCFDSLFSMGWCTGLLLFFFLGISLGVGSFPDSSFHCFL